MLILDAATPAAASISTTPSPTGSTFTVPGGNYKIATAASNEGQEILDFIMNEGHVYDGSHDPYQIKEYTFTKIHQDQCETEIIRAEDTAAFFRAIYTVLTFRDLKGKTGSPIGAAVGTAYDYKYNPEPCLANIPDLFGMNDYFRTNITKEQAKTFYIEHSAYKYLIYSGKTLWMDGPRQKFIEQIEINQKKIKIRSEQKYNYYMITCIINRNCLIT